MPADPDLAKLIVKSPADVVRHLIVIQFDVSNVQLNSSDSTVVVKNYKDMKTLNSGFTKAPVLIRTRQIPASVHSRADLLYNFSNDQYAVEVEVHTRNTSAFSWAAFWETKRCLEANRKIQTSQDANLSSSIKTYYDILYIGDENPVSDSDGGPNQINILVTLKVRSRAIGAI